MYINVIQMQVKPCNAIEANRIWQESILPELESQPGWKNGAFAPMGIGKAVLFTLWDTEAAAQGFGTTPGYQNELTKLTHLGTDLKRLVYRLGTAEEEAYAKCKQPALNVN